MIAQDQNLRTGGRVDYQVNMVSGYSGVRKDEDKVQGRRGETQEGIGDMRW